MAPPSAFRTLAFAAAAVAAGLVIGWIDLSATEVQGPLLLLLVSAFVLTLLGGRPPWLVGALVAAGIPALHALAALSRRGPRPGWDVLIVFLPGIFAAYSGFAVALVLRSGASALGSEAHSRGLSWRTLLTAAVAGTAAAGAIPVWATLSARAQPIAWWVTLWWQVATLVGWAALAPILLRFVRPSAADTAEAPTAKDLLFHLAMVVALAVAHSLALPLVTRILMVPLGPGGFRAAAGWALAAYLPMDALTYVLIVTLSWSSDRERLARAAAERTAALSSELSRAELDALRSQIQPHFLFNALNAVTVLARSGNAAGAAAATEKLAELLRHALGAGASPEQTVPLADEIVFAERYLGLEALRFGDRLRYTIDVDPDARRARVPALILQPIVENAVRHGIARRTGGDIAIGGRVVTSSGNRFVQVRIENRSDGAAVAAVNSTSGVGLANVRARLLVIYGTRATLTLDTDVAGGAVAVLTIPHDA